jgi:N-methylhydantoinase B
MEMTTSVNTILGEVLRSQLVAAVDDMGQVLSRNSVSSEIVQEHDFANAILLEKGEVVACDNLLHLGAMRDTGVEIQDSFQFALKPGDVILCNDPFAGGTHVQDFTTLTPFHHGRDQICYLSCRAHLPDIGGQVPGGYYPFADDVWAEGSRIPPLKIVQEGKLVGDKIDAVLINSRVPDLFHVDLQAMLASLETGRRRLSQIVDKYGKQNLAAGLRYCIDTAESEIRAEVAGWPAGQFDGMSILDHDARGGTDLTVHVTLSTGPNCVLDFSRSSPQSPGFVNSSRANTVSYALVSLYGLLSDVAPINSGLLRVVELKTIKGTVVDPRFPAAVGWGPYHVGAEIVSAVGQAVAQMFPERVADLAPRFMLLLARWPRLGTTYPLHTFLQSGASGSHGVQGWGVPGPFSRATIPSVEMVESEFPLQVRRLELLADSAGSGTWRGGFGTIGEFNFREPTLLGAVVEGEAHVRLPSAGGCGGTPNSLEIGGSAIHGVAWEQDISGQTLIARMGGGPGWGDPAKCDPALTAEDVANELISVDHEPPGRAQSGAMKTTGSQRQR